MTHTAKGLRQTMMAAAAGLIVVALAACTPGGASAPTDGDGTPDRIVLQTTPFTANEPVQIAVDEGLFKKYDLDVEVSKGPGLSQAIAPLISGEADITMTGSTTVMNAAAEGLDVGIILGALSLDDPDKATSGVIAPPDSGIASCADLGGKTIALSSLADNPQLALLSCAEKAGVDTSTITFVQVPVPNLNDAVLSGKVDAGFSFSTFLQNGLAQGLELVIDSGALNPDWSNIIYTATGAYVSAHKDAVKRFIQAMSEAMELGRADDYLRIRKIQIERSDTDPDFLMSIPLDSYNPQISRKGTQQILDLLYKFKFISKQLTVDKVVNTTVAPMVK